MAKLVLRLSLLMVGVMMVVALMPMGLLLFLLVMRVVLEKNLALVHIFGVLQILVEVMLVV